jgi:hypothetical protein
MSTPAFNRAQNDIQKWVKDPRIPIDQSGADFLVACLDPCHDTQLTTLDGWPDLETGASVTRCIKQSITVSGTSGGSAPLTNPWDMHIVLNPFLDVFSNGFTFTTERANNSAKTSDASAISNPYGGLTVGCAFGSGTPVDYFSPGFNSALGQIGLDAAYSNGLGRVTGIAFEVVDTTSALHQQGSCFVWRQMASRDQVPTSFTTLNTDEAVPTQAHFNGVIMPNPPGDAKAAMLIPGTRNWASKEGCYVVAPFHSSDNPPIQTGYTQPVFLSAGERMQHDVFNVTTMRYPTPFGFQVLKEDSVQEYVMQPTKIYPYHMCGAMFTGLDPLSTFRITLVVYYETFPTTTLIDLPVLVMARPSMPYNPYLLELLAHAMQNMPVGVMFKENGMGTWFATAVRAASKYLAAPASLVNPLLGMAVKSAGEIANTYLQPAGQPQRSISKRKKVQNKNQQLANRKRGKKGAIQGPKNKKPSKADIDSALTALKNFK